MSWDNTTNSNMTLNRILDILNLLKQEFIVYLPILFIIFGMIGFIFNAFTFLQPSLRFNSCCIYLLCGSLIDAINLSVNLLSNYVHSATDYILSLTTTSYLCKLKLFSLVFLPQLSINLLILSLIDRYSCTSSLTSSIRRIRQLKMVPWLIILIVIISAIMSFYAPLNYDVVPNAGCVCTNKFWNGVSYVTVHGLITPLMMLVFVLLTYRNVKQSKNRAGLIRTASVRRSRKPFIKMIITQVCTTSFLTLQWIAFYTYHLITVDNIKTDEQRIVHYFLWYLSNNIYYLINVKSFYLSTLTSRLFRKTLLKALAQKLSKFKPRKNNKNTSETFVNVSARNRSDQNSRNDS